jgi:hypothetical protein
LFVPFGFGLAAKLREKGKSGAKVLLFTVLAGALLSYCIEFLQIYIPTRDSGWEDLFTNTTGAVVGYFLFEVAGKSILTVISALESRLERLLTARRALWILSLYFVIWFAVSMSLQGDSKLENWTHDSRLVIGNDAAGHLTRTWKGNISSVQFWNRAMPSNIAMEITAGKSIPDGASKPLAAFVFSGDPLLEDKNHFISKLIWTPNTPDVSNDDALTLNGSSWIISQADVGNLIQALQKTNNFSLRVVCAPAEVR